MKPKVSIIIACYNDPDVGTAVKSAYEQTYPNKEIILIDDGSGNETKTAIEAVQNYVTRLIVQNNQGQSNARNKAIAAANGEFILNLDSDDYFEKDFCERAVAKFLEDEQIKIVTCKARRFNKKGSIDEFTPQGGELKDFLFSNSALGSAMFKRSDWEMAGGYEEKLPILGYEDWEFYISLLKYGGRAYVIPEVLFNYQVREGSITQRIKKKRHEKYKRIILKHKELYLENFEGLVNDLFIKLSHTEIERDRIEKKLDFKIGKFALKPLRVIKNFFK